MDKDYILVVGKGTTSRANLEALMEDYLYAHKTAIVLLPFEGRPTQGQQFAAQLAKDKSIDVIVFNNKDDAPGIPSCTVVESDKPHELAVEYMMGKGSAFFLWSDEDQDCLNTLAYCKDAGVPCLDLTDGLNAIKPADNIKAEEKIVTPEAENETVDGTEEEPEEELEEDDEEESEESDMYEDVYFGIEALAKMIAKAVVDEIDARKSPSKGSKKP